MPATTTFLMIISLGLPLAATNELRRSTLAGISLAPRKSRESFVLSCTQRPNTGIGGQAILETLAPSGDWRRNRVQSALPFCKCNGVEYPDHSRQAIGLIHEPGQWHR